MKLSISVQDFAKAIVMDPGWRKAKIKSVEREQNAAKTGMNTVLTFEVENGILPHVNMPDLRDLKQWYSDAYPANWLPLLEALLDRKFTLETFSEDLDFDPNEYIGTEVWVEIGREPIIDKNTKKDTGRLQNSIKGFLNIDNSPL
jgi:hypothetical protein